MTRMCAAILLCATLAHGIDPFYNSTIDCSSFSRPGGYSSADTCLPEGDWTPIFDRPLPEYYADMKFGIFIHWGVYSVPSYGTEWYWHNVQCGNKKDKAFQDRVYGPDYKYKQFVPQFKAELYDADAWVKTIKGSGAQYVLPVAKHHDGFTMWESKQSPGWNAVEVGPKRDVLTELYNASVKADLPFGIYYSQGEWFDADMVNDHKNNFTTNAFITKKVIPQRLDLVTRYPKAMLWHTDGGWFAPDHYWGNLDWLTYLYNKSPLASRVVSCNSLGFQCCAQRDGKCWEYGDAPSGGDRTTAGRVISHYYTNQMTIQKGSWSYDRSEPLDEYFTTAELVHELIQTTAWNGTLIMNIGPTDDGRITPIFEERLADIGAWLKVNGNSIYSTRPWRLATGMEAGSNSTYYTQSKDGSTVYAIMTVYPTGSKGVVLMAPKTTAATTATLLNGNVPLKYTVGAGGKGMVVQLPPQPIGSSYAWVVALTGVQ